MEIKIVKKINTDYFDKKNLIALYSEEKDLETIVNNAEEINTNNNQRVNIYLKNSRDYLQSLSLEETILKKKIKELSYTEYKFILLIKAVLLNPEMIVLNNFEKGIPPKYQNIIWHFIKNIILSKNIKFIILSKDLKFINKITNKVIIIENKKIKYEGLLLDAIKENYLKEPVIYQFITNANEKGANLTPTLDRKELLKDIYRNIT